MATNAELDDQIVMLDRQRAEAGRLSTFTPVAWRGRPTPRRQWCVDSIIPYGNVTMLSGDGAAGKTLLAMQLQAAGWLGSPWLGMPMTPIRSLGRYCEDDRDELHRRMADIAAHYDVGFDRLTGVHLSSRVGDDNVLVRFDRNDVAQPTALYDEIEVKAADLDVRLIVLDSLHDLFGGDEIKRSHARQFIGHLRRLALKINGAVLLNAHPSIAGMNSGTGSSGSTAWNNAVRSRLYLTRPQADDNADDDVRILRTVKSNYAALGRNIEMKWRDGVFACNAPSADPSGHATAIFLQCLDKTTAEGRYASAAKNSQSYAPKMFLGLSQANGVSRDKLERAMEQLFAENKIRVADHRKSNRHTVEAIVKVAQ